jgi:heme-degrading monooxygenase HmoA
MRYSRIAIYEMKAGTANQTVRRAEEDLAPLVRQQAGFISYSVYQAGDREIGSVSVWESRAAADKAALLIQEWVKRNMAADVVSTRSFVGELAFESTQSAFAGAETRPSTH